MRPDRRGLAGLFDALIFLAIASLVSVSLLSALGGLSPAGGHQSERVDAAHITLLRSTVLDEQGNQVTIEELFMLKLAERVDRGKNITSILDLLLPGTEWRWSVQTDSQNWCFGRTTILSGPVFCSTFRAPFNGSEVVYRLDCWAAQS